jgi:hypothetical protein
MDDAEKIKNERIRIYENTRADLLSRQKSNSEQYDKALLTLSSAALGISVTFVTDYVSAHEAVRVWALYGSWLLLFCSIIVTMASFLISQESINEQLHLAESYYLNNDESALRVSKWARYTDHANLVAGGLFLVGVLLTIVFMYSNVEVQRMSEKKVGGEVVTREGVGTFGERVPAMQVVTIVTPVVPETRGQPVATMQPAPASQGGGVAPSPAPGSIPVSTLPSGDKK